MTNISHKSAPLFSKIAWGMGGLPEMLANNAILVWAGVKEGEVTELSMDIINKLRIMYVVVPVIAFGLGIWVMINYPLTKIKMLDIHRQLEERR